MPMSAFTTEEFMYVYALLANERLDKTGFPLPEVSEAVAFLEKKFAGTRKNA
jgi:hypothetical protein